MDEDADTNTNATRRSTYILRIGIWYTWVIPCPIFAIVGFVHLIHASYGWPLPKSTTELLAIATLLLVCVWVSTLLRYLCARCNESGDTDHDSYLLPRYERDRRRRELEYLEQAYSIGELAEKIALSFFATLMVFTFLLPVIDLLDTLGVKPKGA